MTLTQDWQRDIFSMVKFDEFLSNLKNCRIADIGKIEDIVDKGARATVRLLDGSNRLLKAEVFGASVRSGQFCLLIIPATPFDTTRNGLDVAERSYASTYAKCFPLQAPNFSSVQLAHEVDRLSVTTPKYILQCDEEGISAIDSKGFSVALKEGVLSLANNEGSADVVVNDEGIKVEAGNSYTEAGEKTTKTVLNLDETGVHIKVGDDTNINIDTEGKTTIAVKELSLTGDVTIDGTLKVTGAVTMDDTLSVAKNFDAAGKNFTADV